MNMNYKIKCGMLAYGMWGSLGFYRGANYYNYVQKNIEKNKNVLFIHTFSFGMLGAGLYVLPLTNVFTLYKECIRLEMYARKLDKHTLYYYYLLP